MLTPRKCSIPREEQWSNLQKLDHGHACSVWQLRTAMDVLGWRLEELADFADVSMSTAWRWTNGLVAIPAGKLKAITIEARIQSIRELPRAEAV